MENTYLLELQISSQEEEVISKVKDTVKSSDTQELSRHRADVVTILGIASTVVKLLSDLLDLYKKIKSKEIKAPVVVKNIDGESLDLANTTEKEIEHYVNRLGK
jgi:hypothetical protein